MIPTNPLNDLPFPTNTDTAKVVTLLIEVVASNPNGDPDNGGAPRQDPITGHGLISGYRVKRMIRDIAHDHHSQGLFVGRGDDLSKKQLAHSVGELMNLFDVRTFGASLTKHNRPIAGPVVIGHGYSLDPVSITEMGLTRVAGYREVDSKGNELPKLRGTMGTTSVVDYGVYRFDIFIDPFKATRTGMTGDDLARVYDGLINGWPYCKAAGRPHVNLRRAYLLDYGTKRCSLPDHVVSSWIQAKKRIDIPDYPTCFEDYEIQVDLSKMRPAMRFFSWEDGECSQSLPVAAK